MYHIHLPTCESTQSYLIKRLEDLEDPHILVTTSKQTKGVGRGLKKWDSLENSMALSFTLAPSSNPTLMPLVVGVLACDFFGEFFKVQLSMKWPNDLMVRGHKCGGIIMKLVGKTLVCGFGLNLVAKRKDAPMPRYGHLFDSLPASARDLSVRLYRYILEHNFSTNMIVEKFHHRCVHWGKTVTIDDDGETVEGIFEGINSKGGAVISTGDGERIFYTGHLTYGMIR